MCCRGGIPQQLPPTTDKSSSRGGNISHRKAAIQQGNLPHESVQINASARDWQRTRLWQRRSRGREGCWNPEHLNKGLQVGVQALQVAGAARLQPPRPVRKRRKVTHHPALCRQVRAASLFLHVQCVSACKCTVHNVQTCLWWSCTLNLLRYSSHTTTHRLCRVQERVRSRSEVWTQRMAACRTVYWIVVGLFLLVARLRFQKVVQSTAPHLQSKGLAAEPSNACTSAEGALAARSLACPPAALSMLPLRALRVAGAETY